MIDWKSLYVKRRRLDSREAGRWAGEARRIPGPIVAQGPCHWQGSGPSASDFSLLVRVEAVVKHEGREHTRDYAEVLPFCAHETGWTGAELRWPAPGLNVLLDVLHLRSGPTINGVPMANPSWSVKMVEVAIWSKSAQAMSYIVRPEAPVSCKTLNSELNSFCHSVPSSQELISQLDALGEAGRLEVFGGFEVSDSEEEEEEEGEEEGGVGYVRVVMTPCNTKMEDATPLSVRAQVNLTAGHQDIELRFTSFRWQPVARDEYFTRTFAELPCPILSCLLPHLQWE